MAVKSAVVFWYGPNKAATAEIQLVRDSKILDILPPGKKLLAEGGFVGATAKQIASNRWRMEAAFSRLKTFEVKRSSCFASLFRFELCVFDLKLEGVFSPFGPLKAPLPFVLVFTSLVCLGMSISRIKALSLLLV